MKRGMAWTTLSLMAILLLLGTAVLTTAGGLRLSLNLASVVIPGQLTVAEVKGSVLSPFKLSNVEYRYQDTHVSVTELQVEWRLSALLLDTLHITNILGKGVRVDLPPQNPMPQETRVTLPDIHLPLKIVLEQGELEQITLVRADDEVLIELKQVVMQAESKADQLQIKTMNVDHEQGSVQITGRVHPRARYPMDWGIEWQWYLPDPTGQSRGQGNLSGDLDKLQLVHKLTLPVESQLKMELLNLMGEFRWHANLSISDLSSRLVSQIEMPDTLVSSKIQAQGTWNTVQSQGSFQGNNSILGNIHGDWRINAADSVVEIDEFSVSLEGEATTIQTSGRVDISEPLQYQIQSNWESLTWPVRQTQVISKKGNLQLDGKREDYQFNAEFEIAGNHIPSGDWKIQGEGNFQQLKLTSVLGKVLGGNINAHAEAIRLPHWQWHVHFSGDQINPGAYWSAWPGNLKLTAELDGQWLEGKVSADFNLKKLSGQLHGTDVHAAARITMADDIIDIKELQANKGRAQVTIQGKVLPAMALNWQVNADDLRDVHPAASGSIQAGGKLSGLPQAPFFELKLDAKQLHITEYRIDSLVADMLIDFQDQQPLKIAVTGSGVKLLDKSISSVVLRVAGTMVDHRVNAGIELSGQKLTAELDGTYRETAWNGQVQKILLRDENLGSWQSSQAVPVSFSAAKIRLGRICMKQNQAQVCMESQFEARKAELNADILDFPMALLRNLMPADLLLHGMLQGSVVTSKNETGQLIVNSRLTVDPGRIEFPQQEEQAADAVNFKSMALQVVGSIPGTLNGEYLLEFENTDQVQVILSLHDILQWPVNPAAQVMRGKLKVKMKQLGEYERLLPAEYRLPETRNLRGLLEADLGLGGTLSQPKFSGQVTVTEGSLGIPRLGLELIDIKLTAKAKRSNRLQFQGNVSSGEGTLAAKGDLVFAAKKPWRMDLRISGENVEISHIPEARIIVSPRVNINIVPYLVNIDGEIDIPRARVQPQDIGQAITVSEDVVLVGEEITKLPARTWQVNSRLRLNASDSIRFIGYGYDGRIGGNLLIIEEPGKLTRAQGELYAVDGSHYTAFGRKLLIEDGKLYFADSPLDNPNMDVSAIRQIGEIVTGVKVTGTMRDPQLTLFSRPAMDEVDVLSYMTLGRPMSDATQAEGELLL